jgi:hypothetical protein
LQSQKAESLSPWASPLSTQQQHKRESEVMTTTEILEGTMPKATSYVTQIATTSTSVNA